MTLGLYTEAASKFTKSQSHTSDTGYIFRQNIEQSGHVCVVERRLGEISTGLSTYVEIYRAEEWLQIIADLTGKTTWGSQLYDLAHEITRQVVEIEGQLTNWDA